LTFKDASVAVVCNPRHEQTLDLSAAVLHLHDLKMRDQKKIRGWKMQNLENDGRHFSNESDE